MQNLLFFDIDGTIIDETGLIPSSTVDAIRSVRQHGDVCIINTGRPFGHIDPRVKAIGFDGYICSCGQHIELDGSIVHHAGFSASASREIAETVKRCHLNALYEAEIGVWVDFQDPLPDILRYDLSRFASYGLKTRGSIWDPDFQFDKFCVWKAPEKDLAPLKDLLRDRCTMIDRGREGFYECVLKDYSKATGIERVRALKKISLDRCYAFGDGPNDLPMLLAVSHAAAMGNAPDSVKKICEYVTGTLQEDGIAKGLSHFGLI